MKGGVTSGIVYPLAVQELSSEYWFKNIGGTSAGAIAAGVTAAAECNRRRSGKNAGFERLALLPGDLARDNFLLSLFRPDPETKRVFEVILSGMDAKQSGKSMWGAIVAKLFLNFLAPLCFAIVLSLVSCVLLWHWIGGSRIPYFLLAFVISLILVPFFVLRSALGDAKRSLIGNGFGFCSGFDAKAGPGGPPLTNWLYTLLNEVAAQPAGEPLTFGHLWTAPDYPDEPAIKYEYRCVEQEKRAINLEVMTTNLTLGCPSRIPFDTKGFFFEPSEWSKLFPAQVVDWMVSHAFHGARKARTAGGQGSRPVTGNAGLADCCCHPDEPQFSDITECRAFVFG